MTEAGQRRRDDSCAPDGRQGAWVVMDRPSMSGAAQDYQRQISRTPDLPSSLMLEYAVTNPATAQVTMDGCALWSPERELLEAKYGYGSLFAAGERHGFEVRARNEMVFEAQRQEGVIGRSHPIEWQASDSAAHAPVAARHGARPILFLH